VAVHVTVVRPSTKVEPEGGSHVTDGDGSATSVEVTSKLTTVGPPAATVIPSGTFSVGGVASLTRILNVAQPVLPYVSVALQVTTLTCIGKKLPDGGLHVTGTGPSTASTAEAL